MMPILADPANRARAYLVLAAVLWSLGSVTVRLLQHDLGLGLHQPDLSSLQIAYYRGLFGGLFVLVLVRRKQITFDPRMIPMVVTFAVMSGLYLTALSMGAAANAIFLQNTAPMWVYVFAVVVFKEAGDRRGWLSVILAACGAGVIVAGGWPSDLSPGDSRRAIVALLMGLASGVAYAGVVLFLRTLQEHASVWLVTLNLLGTAIVIGLFIIGVDGLSGFTDWVLTPSETQLAVLIAAGVLQMGVPYLLFIHGLRHVPVQEAAIITLIEPLLNPLWAYLLTPQQDTPTATMLAGGSLILLALAWRYMPEGDRHTRKSTIQQSS